MSDETTPPETNDTPPGAPPNHLVIVFQPDGNWGWRVFGSVPCALIVNALEFVKDEMLRQQRTARENAARQRDQGGIMDAHGRPYRSPWGG